MNLRIAVFPLLFLFTFSARAQVPVCVIVDKVKMRAEPSANAPISWTVTRNMPLMGLTTKGGWTQVEDVDKEKHWLPANTVSSQVACAVIKAKVAKLRRAPSSTSPLAEMPIVDKYTPFKRVGREEAWIEIEDDYNERFWVNEKSVWYPVRKMKIKF